jgi:hypothetical protein
LLCVQHGAQAFAGARQSRAFLNQLKRRHIMANEDRNQRRNEPDLNRDPITGTPGAHPIGTGAGAAAGGIAGAAAGTAIGGPAGTIIGAAVGAVAGGLAGKGAAELVNPTVEEEFWMANYVREPYYVKGTPYEYYAPAYRTGWEGRARYSGQQFDDVEDDLRANYETYRTDRSPKWDEARHAARSAWKRLEKATG